MILLDSSVLIEYYRLEGEPKVQRRVAEVIRNQVVAVNGIIWTELLAFAANERTYQQLSSDFRAFYWLDITFVDCSLASKVGFAMRRKGITVPTTDLLIAANAVSAKATLYHLDAHFDAIQAHSRLAAENLKPRP